MILNSETSMEYEAQEGVDACMITECVCVRACV